MEVRRTVPVAPWWLPQLLLVVAIIVVYANSLNAPFLFDDGRTILDNLRLHHWWPVWESMRGTTRPLVLWTLAHWPCRA